MKKISLALAVMLLGTAGRSLAGELRVLRVTPTGEEAETGRQLVISFDRDVVPLGRMERKPDEIPVTITPALECEWRWMDPRTLNCNLPAAAPLKPATHYVVEIRPQIETLSGDRMAAAMRHEFSTQRPLVTQTRWSDWLGAGSPVLEVYFNQPVGARAVAQALYFVTPGGPIAAKVEPTEHYYGPHVSLPDGDEGRLYWQVRPSASDLGQDRAVELRVRPGLKSAEGPLRGTESRQVLAFRTYPAFRVVGLRCAHVKADGTTESFTSTALDVKKTCDPLDAGYIMLSAPADVADFKSRLRIRPDPYAGKQDFDPFAGVGGYVQRNQPPDKEGFEVRLPFDWQAMTQYRVDLLAGIKDVFGRELPAGSTIKFRTGHRAPRIHLQHPVAVLEAGEDTQPPLIVSNIDELLLSYRRYSGNAYEPGLSSREAVNSKRDVAYAIPFDVRKLLAGRSGAVSGRIDTLPGTEAAQGVTEFFAEVTPWQVHVKLGHFSSLAWVTDLKTGLPIGGAKVEIYRGRDHGLEVVAPEVPASALTDFAGLARLPGTEALDPTLSASGALTVRVSRGFELALLPLDYEFEVNSGSVSNYAVYGWLQPKYSHLRSWGTTAQGVYRAGDKVQYKVYVRAEENRTLKPPPPGRYKLRVLDPTNQPVHERNDVALSEFGALHGEFQVPPQAPVGWYRFELSADFLEPEVAVNSKTGEEMDEDHGRQARSLEPLRVLISDFTPAPFKSATEIHAKEVQRGGSVELATSAALHAGGPYSNAKARLVGRIREQAFQPEAPGLEDFSFRAEGGGDACRPGYHRADVIPVVEENATLDAQGQMLTQAVLPAGPDYGRFEVEGSAQDDRGRSVASTASVPFYGLDRYAGLRHQGWLLEAGKPDSIEWLVVDRSGKPVSGAKAKIEIERCDVSAARVKGAGNAYLLQYARTPVPVGECKGESGAQALRCTFTPPRAGAYLAVATIEDTQGKTHRAELSMWAAGKEEVLWAENPDYTLRLMPDRKDYHVGDKARVMVQNPFPGAQALVSVERYGVIDSWVQKLEGSTPILEIPVQEDYLPGFYLSVTVMSPRVADAPLEQGLDLGKPTFRMGYVQLAVKDPYKDVQVQVEPAKEKYRPRDTVKVKLRAQPRNPRTGEKLELAVAVLDEAVFDMIQGGTAYFDPYAGFYALDSLDLDNFSLITRLVGRQKFEKKGANPGGDGGADLSMRSVDKFVAYWNPALATDAKGRAEFSFEAPDNLTAWRVLAIAVTPGDRLGLGTGTLAVSKPTELRPAMPNQLTVGDRFEAGFTVMNRADKPRTVDVQLKASGAAAGELRREVTLAPFERQTLRFPLTAERVGEIQFTASAGDRSDKDALRHVTPVREARRPLVIAGSYGALAAGETKSTRIEVPAFALPVGDIGASFTPTVLGGLEPSFRYLRDYPYFCWEQRLTTGVMAAHLKQLKPYLEKDFSWPGAEGLPQATLDDAARFQAPDGGMTFWVPDNAYQDPYLSAYTALAFTWLQELGYQPPATVQAKLDVYLQRLLREDMGLDAFEVRGSVRAVVLAALAARGKLDRSELDRFLPDLARIGLFGQALFWQAANRTPDGAAAARRAQDLVLSRGQESAGKLVLREDDRTLWHWLLGSEPRSNCAALSALLAAPLADPALAETPMKLTRAISAARRDDGRWYTTQETLFCTRAMIEYARRFEPTPPSLQVSARYGDAELGSGRLESFTAPAVALVRKLTAGDPGHGADLTVQAAGTGRAYYALRLRYAEKDEAAHAHNAGIEIARHHAVKRAGGAWIEVPAGPVQLRRGDLLRVELELNLPATRQHVAVEDPVPGGIEPVSPDLANASGFDAEEMEGQGMGYPWPFYFRELKHDSVRFFARTAPEGRHRLVWIGQAIADGQFQMPGAHAEEMYDPDIFGNTVPGRVEVSEP
ncbi:MAG TPA: alpha-2-macroglobulin family protein [Solimonas sp.]|nr:alpha-2-macroglobulin family protein [Solimonas sp.]